MNEIEIEIVNLFVVKYKRERIIWELKSKRTRDGYDEKL